MNRCVCPDCGLMVLPIQALDDSIHLVEDESPELRFVPVVDAEGDLKHRFMPTRREHICERQEAA